MARVRARPETGALYLDFFFQGKRCREQTALTDTPGNRRRLQVVLDRLMKDIKAGAFDYACYFPNSRNAARFSANQRAWTASATTIGTNGRTYGGVGPDCNQSDVDDVFRRLREPVVRPARDRV